MRDRRSGSKRIQYEAGVCPIQPLSTGVISSTERVEILTCVVQVALASLLESRCQEGGPEPDAIMGH